MKEHFKLLGFKVRDIVTGFEGIAESVSFDLYGCVQYVIRPPIDKKKSEQPPGHWFDAKRLEKISKQPVMPVPTFAVADIPGGTSKPSFQSQPSR